MKRGFTLIELLIVVAIIAILAAIAVPNFLEAQVRAKVSRAKADIRTLATGLEAYRVENNAYPKCNSTNTSSYRPNAPNADPASDPTHQYIILEHLSTPIAYLSTGLFPDAFRAKADSSTISPVDGSCNPQAYTGPQKDFEASFYGYCVTCAPGTGATGTAVQALTSDLTTAGNRFWCVWSAGPALIHCHVAGNGLLSTSPQVTPLAIGTWIYDPTNGTASPGNIFRTGGTGLYPPDPGGVFFSLLSVMQK